MADTPASPAASRKETQRKLENIYGVLLGRGFTGTLYFDGIRPVVEVDDVENIVEEFERIKDEVKKVDGAVWSGFSDANNPHNEELPWKLKIWPKFEHPQHDLSLQTGPEHLKIYKINISQFSPRREFQYAVNIYLKRDS